MATQPTPITIPVRSITSQALIANSALCLITKSGTPRPPTAPERDVLRSIFPTTTFIGFSDPFLILLFSVLPPKPWPITVGQVPAYFTIVINDHPLLNSIVGNGLPCLKNIHLPPGKVPSNDIFSIIIQQLQRHYALRVVSVLWLTAKWVVALEPSCDISRGPSMMLGRVVTYTHAPPAIEEKGPTLALGPAVKRRDLETLRFGEILYFDSARRGSCTGVFTMLERKLRRRIGWSPGWTTVVWVYVGNGRRDSNDGDGVVWDCQGNSVGLFGDGVKGEWVRAIPAEPIPEASIHRRQV